MKGKRILLIEDNEREAEAIVDYIEPLGCMVSVTHSSVDGLAAIKLQHPDVVVLDIQLDTENEGFQVLKALREDPLARSIPVVVFSVTGGEVENRIRGLRLGAYYYLLKTSGLSELEATIRRALEIREQHLPKSVDPHTMPLYFDKASGTIWIDGRKADIKLSAFQRKLLALLVDRRGRICSRDEIAIYVYETDVSNQTIDRLVSRLREKLGDKPLNPRFIESVRGVGYKLLLGQIEA